MDNDIDSIRREYKRQRQIEQITTSRVFARPSTTKWQIAIYTAVFICLVIFGIVSCFFLKTSIPFSVLYILFLVLLVFELYLRFCLIEIVKCYQHYADYETRRTCKCVPSCSEYAILTLKKVFPLFWALLKIRRRLFVVCNGQEYVIDFPTKRETRQFNSQL